MSSEVCPNVHSEIEVEDLEEEDCPDWCPASSDEDSETENDDCDDLDKPRQKKVCSDFVFDKETCNESDRFCDNDDEDELLQQHIASLKRNLSILGLCKFLDEEKKTKQPLPKKRKRNQKRDRRSWRNAKHSRWWHLLKDPQTKIKNSYAYKLWVKRFRVPVQIFERIVQIFKDKGWYEEKSGKDPFGRSHPFELKMMGTFRYLGRGEVFDTIAECCGDYISAETFRTFTTWHANYTHNTWMFLMHACINYLFLFMYVCNE